MKRRSYCGYVQFKHSSARQWKFLVDGYDTATGGAGRCRLLRTDGQSRAVPIDANDNILVAGRKYGPDAWQH